ncbi:MAG: hypothetical protein GXO08_06275 [Aquificae bacterium]|nr:hypothetical protein [Aquificota bacterium]
MERKLLFLLAFLLPVYLYGIDYLPLRGEEPNRVLTAYEMVYFGDPFNLTHLGEPYYNKPPLFMWVVALFSTLLGWGEVSARLVSVLSVFATALLVYSLYRRLFGGRRGALLAALFYASFADLALFYGFLAEIDAFHAFLLFSGVFAVFKLLERGRTTLALGAVGLFTALLFLTKGFPALYHLPVSALALLTYFGSLGAFLSPTALLLGLSAFAAPLLVWYLNLENPYAYLRTLWNETFSRTPVAQSSGLWRHLLEYPLLTLKQSLPASALALLYLLKEKKVPASREFFLLLFLFLLNYLPYLVSPGAQGRYALVAFPFLALLLARLLENAAGLLLSERLGRFFAFTSLLLLPVGLYLVYENLWFFERYGLWQAAIFGLSLALFGLWTLKRPSTLGGLVLLLAVLKFGYLNYFAPFREKGHPDRPVAAAFASALPGGVRIEYLPREVNMQLCAYLDAYTRGIVLRREAPYFVTREGETPRRPHRVLVRKEGWLLGEYSK